LLLSGVHVTNPSQNQKNKHIKARGCLLRAYFSKAQALGLSFKE